MLNGESTPPVMCFRPGQPDSTKRHSRLVEGVMNAAAASLRLRGPDFEAATTSLARTSALGLAMTSEAISAKKLKPMGGRKARTRINTPGFRTLCGLDSSRLHTL